jgi:pilus assembly protein FimV
MSAPAPEGSITVKRGDTLSKIAGQVKPAEITLDQMLVAMFRANESAFDGRNMNRLRTGAILTVPSAAEVSTTQPVESAPSSCRCRRPIGARIAIASRPRQPAVRRRGQPRERRRASARRSPEATPRRPRTRSGRVSREARAGKGGASEDAVATEQ